MPAVPPIRPAAPIPAIAGAPATAPAVPPTVPAAPMIGGILLLSEPHPKAANETSSSPPTCVVSARFVTEKPSLAKHGDVLAATSLLAMTQKRTHLQAQPEPVVLFRRTSRAKCTPTEEGCSYPILGILQPSAGSNAPAPAQHG
jgi:hypothetical protein